MITYTLKGSVTIPRVELFIMTFVTGIGFFVLGIMFAILIII